MSLRDCNWILKEADPQDDSSILLDFNFHILERNLDGADGAHFLWICKIVR